ncbi:hypothetical protein CYQ88_10980 [Hydrogenovibrio sp. SC-1]|uniref:site-specific integrase n=1 Tax=Hydrogenovibrio sp. SC-1 TaxID=2065820 RepID=UPI000C7C8625|nr:site-specific integrase [Hydrogenovibrio sp. SC-1]PLA73476.1 hypothetical protein CYQ88_10980 [Hydrogenovibrio sp. SC-1]
MSIEKQNRILAFWSHTDPIVSDRVDNTLIDNLHARLETYLENAKVNKKKSYNEKTIRLLEQLLGTQFEGTFENKSDRTKALKGVVKDLKLSPKDLAFTSQILNALITYGNHHQVWDIGLIPKASLISPEPNPYHPKHIKNSIQFDRLFQKHCEQLEASNNAQQGFSFFQNQIGQFAFSLIADSWVLTESALEYCFQSLLNKQNIVVFQNRIQLVITEDKGMQTHIPLSALTQMIYQRIPSNEDFEGVDAWEEICSYLNIDLKETKSIKHLMTQANAYFKPRLPSIVTQIIKHNMTNYSLLPVTFDRIFSGYRSSNLQICNTIPESTKKGDLVCLPNFEWLEMSKPIRNSSDGIIRDYINRPDLDKNIALFLRYISRNKNYKKNIKSFQFLEPLLSHYCNGQFIESLSEFQRSDLYFDIFEEALLQDGTYSILEELKEFEIWFTKTLERPKITDWDEIFPDKSYVQFVNARIITEDEYKSSFEILRKKQVLHTSVNTVNWFEFARIFLLIGFRLGLRISEVARLKARDFLYCTESPQILIRKSFNRSLKTLNAKRNLQLDHFMNEHEIQVLLEFYEKHHNNSANMDEDRYLFSTSLDYSSPITPDNIVRRMLATLREVTLDPEIKFHSLRHSFATWNFLSESQTAFNIDVSHYFVNSPLTKIWLKQHKKRSAERLQTTEPTSKHFFWLAGVIGHASIATTIHHYIHLASLVIAEYQVALNFHGFTKNLKQIADLFSISLDKVKKNSTEIHKRVSVCLKPYESGYINLVKLPQKQQLRPSSQISIYDFNFFHNFATYQKYAQSGFNDIAYEDQHVIDGYISYSKYNFPAKTTVTDAGILEVIRQIIKAYGEDVFIDGAINQNSQSGKNFIDDLELFMERLIFENRTNKSKEEAVLSISSKYPASIESTKLINKLGYRVNAKLCRNADRNPKEVETIKDYWGKEIGCPIFKFLDKKESSHSIRPNDRIELRVLNKNQKFHSAFIFTICHIYLTCLIEI